MIEKWHIGTLRILQDEQWQVHTCDGSEKKFLLQLVCQRTFEVRDVHGHALNLWVLYSHDLYRVLEKESGGREFAYLR